MQSHMKEYRKNELKYYVIGNILILLLMEGMFDGLMAKVSNDAVDIIETLLGSAINGSIVYIYTFLLDSFMPSKAKDAIAYFPTGRPGDYIFTEIEQRCPDARFTKQQVHNKYSDVYKRIYSLQANDEKEELRKYQNSEWYKIYKKNQDDESVYTSQHDFLLIRDMGSMTIMIVALYIAMVVLGLISFDGRVVAFFIVEFLLSNFATKNKAKRFVYNVIATDLSQKRVAEKSK